MLEPVLGSTSSERVLIFILARGKGYATEISRFFAAGLSPIQKQLDKLESGGVLVCQTAGRTRLYEFNPRYPFLKELKALLEKALSFYPEKEQNHLLMNRRRPRRRRKPQWKRSLKWHKVSLGLSSRLTWGKAGLMSFCQEARQLVYIVSVNMYH